MGEPIAGSNNEGIESVLGLERAWCTNVTHELCAVRAPTVLSIRGSIGSTFDANDESRIFLIKRRVESFFKEWLEAALYVFLREKVWNRNLYPDLLDGTRRHELLHPGVNYGFDQIPS